MKKNHLFKFLIIIFLLTIFLLININNYAFETFQNISNKTFRLHIIANSDSLEDQNLKFLLRDKVIEYFNSLEVSNYNKDEISSILNKHYSELYDLCVKTIKENGFNYSLEISIENSYFPTKKYGDISFPSGYYDCIKIKIGNAIGQNWWCSLFPPLCFSNVTNGIVDDSGKKTLENNLSEEEFLLLSSNSLDIKFKFKIIELLNSLKSPSNQSI